MPAYEEFLNAQTNDTEETCACIFNGKCTSAFMCGIINVVVVLIFTALFVLVVMLMCGEWIRRKYAQMTGKPYVEPLIVAR